MKTDRYVTEMHEVPEKTVTMTREQEAARLKGAIHMAHLENQRALDERRKGDERVIATSKAFDDAVAALEKFALAGTGESKT